MSTIAMKKEMQLKKGKVIVQVKLGGKFHDVCASADAEERRVAIHDYIKYLRDNHLQKGPMFFNEISMDEQGKVHEKEWMLKPPATVGI